MSKNTEKPIMATDGIEPSYNEAIEEVEKILHQMENEETDVDVLSENVKRVSYLINLCREKLLKTKEEVESVLKDIS